MPDLTAWFFEHIVPWLLIGVLGGAWATFRKVDKLQNDMTVLTRDCHQLAMTVDNKWKDVDERVKEDIAELKNQVEYITRNHVSREELNQYLSQLNATVSRLSETLNKFL